MKYLLFIISISFVVLCCNKAPNKLVGEWKILSITPLDTNSSNSSPALAGIIWMNILSNNSIIKFQDIDYTIDNNPIGQYSISNEQLILKNKENVESLFDYTFNSDTLKLTSKSNLFVILLLRK